MWLRPRILRQRSTRTLTTKLTVVDHCFTINKPSLPAHLSSRTANYLSKTLDGSKVTGERVPWRVLLFAFPTRTSPRFQGDWHCLGVVINEYRARGVGSTLETRYLSVPLSDDGPTRGRMPTADESIRADVVEQDSVPHEKMRWRDRSDRGRLARVQYRRATGYHCHIAITSPFGAII